MGVNATFLMFIPKKEGASELSDYRPISLITSLYKIIVKVLLLRLRKVMGKIISPTQSVFMKGKQILDGVLIANECVDWYRKDKKEGLVYKIDLEKAYDKVDWDFLTWALKKKGFSARWIRWIKGYLDHPHFSILLNGVSKGFFQSSHGIKQGDQLSSLLFTIVVDTFNALMSKAIFISLIEGFFVGRDGLCISHLQYADDTMCFIGNSKENVLNLKNILKILEIITGLRMKCFKTSVARIEVSSNQLFHHANLLGCKMECPLKHLGLHLGGMQRSIA